MEHYLYCTTCKDSSICGFSDETGFYLDSDASTTSFMMRHDINYGIYKDMESCKGKIKIIDVNEFSEIIMKEVNNACKK